MNADEAARILWDRKGNRPLLYQPIEHEAFARWDCQQPCVERWDMIVPHLGASGAVLDVGCHTGWFCRQFARRGWRAIGVDTSAEWLSVARWLNEETGLTPEYVLGDVRDMKLPRVDVALCLSVAMYWFAPGDGFAVLDKISRAAPVMFMDYGGMYARRLPEGLPDLIVERTGYTRYTLLGETALEQRPFYMFT